MKNKKNASNNYNFKEKRCPECFTYLKLNAETCRECGLKVGRVDKYGLAKRSINWKAYLVFIFSLLLLSSYIWKTFF